jgi:hypothetical protein
VNAHRRKSRRSAGVQPAKLIPLAADAVWLVRH